MCQERENRAIGFCRYASFMLETSKPLHARDHNMLCVSAEYFLCCRHFSELFTAGLDPNCAAAYALKLTAKTANKANVAALLSHSRPASALSANAFDGKPPQLALDATTEGELLKLFQSGDSLYLSLLLHLGTQPDKGQVCK
jgi:hypothetical protein